ncbi:transposable element Tc1 transposase [Trichonephila clavata]|uniref:Transposable element Tc1 transposase n=1 Tax=Trichonephila clavata TaxID=2740835 RepID=A0A8X6KD28_TRICU|nr:transposable element Tc1 transposase [Trichonephila clavata]
MTEREISKKLGISPSVVHYWLTKRKPTKKTGRKRKTLRETDENIYFTSFENPFLTALEIKYRLNVNCSTETIRNRLKEIGLKNRVPASKPSLTAIHRRKRLEFAQHYIHWSPNDWSKVIFSDEKIFSSASHGPPRVWRPDGHRFDEKYIVSSNMSGRFTIAIWVCIGYVNAIHLIIRPTMNSEYYIDNILKIFIRELEDKSNFYFMHDRSPIHTSHVTSNWLINNGIQVLWDWPPKGPDMNPVENVFAEMERKLTNRAPRNREELWDLVRDTFQEMMNENRNYVKKLILSMPKRLQLVIEKEGGWTKY